MAQKCGDKSPLTFAFFEGKRHLILINESLTRCYYTAHPWRQPRGCARHGRRQPGRHGAVLQAPMLGMENYRQRPPIMPPRATERPSEPLSGPNWKGKADQVGPL